MPALTYRTIGGNLEFYLFVGPSPEDVVKQYTMVTQIIQFIFVSTDFFHTEMRIFGCLCYIVK